MAASEQSPGKHGQARTRFARAAVIDAARNLFVERGYGSTTVEAISTYSDVPPATVYRLFSSKRGILKALLDVSIAGDDEPVSLPDRPRVRESLADPDPKNQLAGFVAVTSDVNSRTAPIYRILLGAASSDPDAAALLEDLNRQRRAGQGQIARSLARAGAAATRPPRARCRRHRLHPDVARGLPATRPRPRMAAAAVRALARADPRRKSPPAAKCFARATMTLPGFDGLREYGNRGPPRTAAVRADAGQGPGQSATRNRRVVLRAEMGRLSRAGVPRRRQGRDAVAQRQGTRPLLSRVGAGAA